MSRTYLDEFLLVNAKTSTGVGTAQFVGDRQHIMLTLSSTASGNFTIKFQASFADNAPDFNAAATDSNRWNYIQVKDYQNNAAIDGSTGVAFAGTDAVRMFEFNTNGLKWINASITTYTAGTINVRCLAFNNQ